METSSVTEGTNRLLDALPSVQRDRLLGSLSHIWLAPGAVLFEPGQAVDVVDFPGSCLVSLVTPLDRDRIVEVASVGSEGIVGVPVALGGSFAVRAMCSVGGWLDRVGASTFLAAVEHDVDLHDVVDDYLRTVFNQLAQAVACNRLHTTTQRLVRWLLSSDDRLEIGTIPITHEFLGALLGASQTAVSSAAERLQDAGLISYRRGRITLVDRPGLELRACECYGVVKTELDGFVQRAEAHFGRG